MSVLNVVRESFLGQLIYHFSRQRYLRYAEDYSDFPLPDHYAKLVATNTGVNSETATLYDSQRAEKSEHSKTLAITKTASQDEDSTQVNVIDLEKGKSAQLQAQKLDESRNPYIVDWYSSNDPENPRNWSLAKKCFVTFNICLLTFSIYIGSAIFAPGIEDISRKFGISMVSASLGITMFVIGYGVGPMFLSPLSEIPQFGRTSVYMITLAIFVVLQVPTALSKNLGALLPLRFLAGFAGSPALATGGASLIDMWSEEWQTIVIGLWSVAAVGGPVLGPVVGGFAAQAKGWTWTIWMLLWLSGTSCAFLLVFLPETSAQALLYRRAVRLRRLTGDVRFKSEGELQAENMTVGEVAHMTLIRPFILGFTEPIVAFWNVYIALVYGILYLFISAFSVVFVEIYHFSLSQNGLAFLGLIVGVVITFVALVVYSLLVLRPKFADGTTKATPESLLPFAMIGGILLPISMFWFGWSASPNIHWIVPIIGTTIYSSATFLLFQAGLNYLPQCYPQHIASVLAGNDFFRSMVGAAFPVFGTAFFHNLGVGPAASLLGGIAVLLAPVPFIMYKYGPKIRSWSKYTD